MPVRTTWVAVVIAIACACEGVSHESIDEWRETQKGPGKLSAALASAEHDPDLRAHAAQNLIRLREWTTVASRLETMPEGERLTVVEALVTRLAKDAEVPEGKAPSSLQAGAKDALFELRAHADAPTRDKIDAYLADWLGVNVEDRFTRGRVRGETIVKHIGRVAAPKLLARARQIIATPPDAKGRIPFMADDVLKGLAYAGSPEAAQQLLELAVADYPEPSLQRRAMAALFLAYVGDLENPRPDPAALKPHAERLLAIIRDGAQPGGNVNDAFGLLAAMGAPECKEPLLGLIRAPDDAEAFLWVAVQKGLLCTGATDMAEIVEAMPTEWKYERGILEKYLWKKMLKLEPRHAVAASCRTMLNSGSWVARVSGVECLGEVGTKADAAAVAALGQDAQRLAGWWGDQSELPRAQRKPAPTLGAVAQAVAKKLEIM